MRHHDGTYRSTREAWPVVARLIATVVLFGVLGALLGWGGRPL